MNNDTAIQTVPALANVADQLQIMTTVCGYADDKTPVKKALQEISVMSNGMSAAQIKEALNMIMDEIGNAYQVALSEFNERTGSEIDTISLQAFTDRYQAEVTEEHGGLKSMSSRIIEMGNELALAFGFSVPAPTAASNTPKPKKSVLKALKSLVVVEEARSNNLGEALGWLTPAVLKEEDQEVQQFLLIYNKYNETKSVDAVRAFVAKFPSFKDKDAAILQLIQTVMQEAYKQISVSDQIISKVNDDYNRTAKIVTVLLSKRDEVLKATKYLSDGK